MNLLKELYQKLLRNIKFITFRISIYYNKKRFKELALKKGNPVYLLRKNIKIKRLNLKLNHIKLEPYKIEKKLGIVTYKLKFSDSIKIYPVFHILLLELAP